MSKLELLGALFAKSCTSEHRMPDLARLIDEAKSEISDELDDEQHALWERLGMPDFQVPEPTRFCRCKAWCECPNQPGCNRNLSSSKELPNG